MPTASRFNGTSTSNLVYLTGFANTDHYSYWCFFCPNAQGILRGIITFTDDTFQQSIEIASDDLTLNFDDVFSDTAITTALSMGTHYFVGVSVTKAPTNTALVYFKPVHAANFTSIINPSVNTNLVTSKLRVGVASNNYYDGQVYGVGFCKRQMSRNEFLAQSQQIDPVIQGPRLKQAWRLGDMGLQGFRRGAEFNFTSGGGTITYETTTTAVPYAKKSLSRYRTGVIAALAQFITPPPPATVTAGWFDRDLVSGAAAFDATTYSEGWFDETLIPQSTGPTGSSAGTGGASGTLTGTGALAGESDGVGGQSGSLTGAGALAGTAAGTGGETGGLVVVLAGTAAGSGAASGTLTGAGALAGTAAGSGTASGTVSGAGALAGESDGTGGESGALKGAGALAGSSAGTGGESGSLTGSGAIAGTATGAATATGTIGGAGALAGGSAGIGGQSGTLKGTGALAGESDGAGSASAQARGTGALAGESDGAGAASGTLTSLGSGAAAGTSAGQGGQSGTLTGLGALAGESDGGGAGTGSALGTGVVAGAASGQGGESGALAGAGSLAGESDGIGDATGTGSSIVNIAGAAAGVGGASATLTVASLHPPHIPGRVTLTDAPTASLALTDAPTASLSLSDAPTATLELSTNMAIYYIGDEAELTAEWADLDGVPTNPSSATIKVRDPAGTETSYVFGTDPGVENPSAGVFTKTIGPLTQHGTWTYRGDGTGAVTKAGEKTFTVRKSAFDNP